jgi:hypothetical protein
MGQPLWPQPIQTKPFLSLALWEIVKHLKVFHFAHTWKGKSQFHVIKGYIIIQGQLQHMPIKISISKINIFLNIFHFLKISKWLMFRFNLSA